MLPVLLAQQVKQLEQLWAEQNQGSTWPLMEKAANAFVAAVANQLLFHPIRVVVGTGNNGGDGYLIASLLHQQGRTVEVFAPFGPPANSIDAYQALQKCAAAGVVIHSQWPAITSSVVVIDALFGSGLTRPLNDQAQAIINDINQHSLQTFAVDIPSGLHADTGQPMPVAIKAHRTISFIALKPGLLTASGPVHCGVVQLETLAIDAPTDAMQYRTDVVVTPERIGDTHKNAFGQVIVVGGDNSMVGAAIIAGRAALATGAGKVVVHCSALGHSAAIALQPELMLANLGEQPLPIAQRMAIVVGPGLGRGHLAQRVTHEALLSQAEFAGVVDADALRILAHDPRPVPGWVLTPHAGEAAALLNSTSQAVQADRVSAAKQLAEIYQTVVVLKGAGTVVASPDQLVFAHPGHAAMATPGMGDCLAGMVGALLATGQPPFQAALNAVNWHAQIGAELAQKRRVVFASDIIAQLAKRR